MAISASDFRNFSCGPAWGLNGFAVSVFIRQFLSGINRDNASPAVLAVLLRQVNGYGSRERGAVRARHFDSVAGEVLRVQMFEQPLRAAYVAFVCRLLDNS